MRHIGLALGTLALLLALTWGNMRLVTRQLDGIDAIQWHGWLDHEQEFGLRIGFRKYGTDPNDPYGKKKSWYVWQAAGTEQEDEVFEPYKKVIGISDWNEIFLD